MKINGPEFVVVAENNGEIAGDGWDVIRGLGYFEGERENVAIVFGEHLDEVLEWARQHGETSVLHVDSNRIADLVYTEDGRRERVGPWRGVGRKCPNEPAWTCVNGLYYVAK